MEQMTKPRGRPRQFDKDLVQSAILQIFWEKGFATTSLDDLSKATGLVRPSLYGAFGSKLDMYLMSMDIFIEKLSSSRAALNSQQSVEGALSEFYRTMIEVYSNDGGPAQLGCFLVGTALVEAPENSDIRTALAERLDRFRRSLMSILAAKSPQTDDADIAFLAEQAMATLHSLAVRARSGESKETLTVFAEKSAAFISQNLTSD